ncbi:tetratricopeptide-like helical domain-containing protein [Dictyostelium discoideum AX4]|uniref:Protein STIP1 homolog n=1 Tax=Dictyostelium discoideum TaxID=44689 RepID=STIP1_DICDI|nr:tetratricopeptide-like helical domain-containing protein [Dictyostelium discoideum AX4]Q54DA8.1 RecName: Full=Protein STIP1 homolog [Dictyostelium discoideum]EAL61181.1 tetratricopeptide-like helical domain-containing protein [Dictyostelium discoideum AX4]|eukprot:XP_629588.1 tetratricopeptide-like helical domain-containing protein [Dictyostelium discoideum AX4]
MSENAQKATEFKNQGNAAFSSKDYNSAVKCFDQAIELDPSNHILYSNRSASLLALDKNEDALTDAKKAIELKPDWSKGYLRETNALYKLGRFEEAEKSAEAGLKIDPTNQQLEDALEDAQYATTGAKDPASAMANLFSAQNLTKLRFNPKTAPFFQQPDFVAIMDQISKNPSLFSQYIADQRFSTCLGVLLGVDINQGPGAPPQSQQPTPQQPTPTPQQPTPTPQQPKPTEAPKKPEAPPMTESQKERDLGNKAYAKKEFEQAIVHYDKAVELDSSDILAMNNKAAVLIEQQKLDEAIETCKKALEKAQEIRADYRVKSKVYTRLGNIYLKKNQLDDAYKAYSSAVLEDKNADTTANMKKIEKLKKQRDDEAYLSVDQSIIEKNKGVEHFKKGEFPEAIKCFEEAIRRNPKDHTIYSNRSAAYSKLLEYKLAIKDADKCIELEPTFIKGYIRKGTALFAMREYQQALEVYDQGLRIEANNPELLDLSRKTVAALTKLQSTLTDEERLQQAAKDPEIQKILSDPIMNQILKDMSENPAAAQDHLKNPLIMAKFQKLVNAGIVKLG